MLDFLKFDLPAAFRDNIAKNDLLEFQARVNLGTGEIENYSTASYKDLEFRIYSPSIANPEGRITVGGSIHKYWNSGLHNFNDFNVLNVQEVLRELQEKFQILPCHFNMKQLEVGVNFRPPLLTETLLSFCLLHKTKRLKWVYTRDEGHYVQAEHKYYYIKMYDKQKHYTKKGFTVPDEVMRFEIKYRRSQLNRILSIKGNITLQDILDYGLENFKQQLLQEWKNVLFYDSSTLDGGNYQERYSNPNFWLRLKPDNFKYHRNKLHKLLLRNPQNLKNKISEAISEKVDSLTSPTQIGTLYI